MTRQIDRLLALATLERARNGAVAADTMMNLAAEGYELDALDDDTLLLNLEN